MNTSSLVKKFDKNDIRYKEQIGEGATSTVFRALVTNPDGTILDAVAKKVNDNYPESNFHEEVKLLMSFEHDNIIKCFGIILGDRPRVMIIELADKGSLRDHLQRRKSLPLNIISEWSKAASRAVAYIHNLQYAHRDIKSPNFVINSENTLKLCDFGLCTSVTCLTYNADDYAGTTRWMAPEVFSKRTTLKESDIFSLGLVIWELWTCKLPFEGKTSTQIMWSVAEEHERPAIPSNVPEPIRCLMKMCWEADPERRPDIDKVSAILTDYELVHDKDIKSTGYEVLTNAGLETIKKEMNDQDQKTCTIL